jgi:arsenate reductase-like glutaredoxin family protein
MADDPELIERPIAEKGGKAVLCRPFERVLEVL